MVVAGLSVWVSVAVPPALGQPINPVYLDDSPTASQTLAGLGDLTASGNLTEAVRVLQGLLEGHGDRLVQSETEEPDGSRLYRTVRWRVHRVLLGDAVLLGRYRAAQGVRARALVARGEHRIVERELLLTQAGYEAVLRVAQEELELARFESARLMLEQLDDHPDRAGADGADAAQLMALVARYLDRDEVWALAQRWTDEAGAMALERAHVAPPARVVVKVASPSLGSGYIELSEMVARPLHSVKLEGAGAAFDQSVVGVRNRSVAAQWLPWVFPAVARDTVYINDGLTISAWDRFTLARRWTVTPGSGAGGQRLADGRGYGRRSEMLIEDTASVGVGRETIVAITGWVLEGQRFGDGRLHAIDRATGRVRWSWHPGEADADLAVVTLRGEPVVVGDVVLVAGRKEVIERRLRSAYLFALDLRTGQVRWQRLLASVGALPYMQDHGLSAGMVVHEGVVYRGDEIGVIAAIEVGTGRVRWIRTSPTAALPSYDPVACFAAPAPVLDGETMVVLSGDRSRVLRVELATGRVLAQRGSGRLGRPRYMLRAGDRLVAIGRDGAMSVAIADFEHGPITRIATPTEDRIVGRAIVSGSRVLLPVDEGIWSFDAVGGGGALVPLKASGNMVALAGQLLVAHGESLHSYLVWEVAEGVLRRRMESDRSDAEPALTFAELSYQAGRTGRLIEAVDRALEAIAAQGSGERAGAARQRLFDLLLAITRRGHAARVAARDGGGAIGGWPEPITDGETLGAVIERLGRTATTSRQRVAQRIARSAFEALEGRTEAALEALAGVLDDELLARTMWASPGLWVRGEVEASRRVRELIEAGGAATAGAHEARADAQLSRAGDDGAALRRVGRRFPGTLAGARAWIRLADGHERAGRQAVAEQALERAAESLDTATGARRDELRRRVVRRIVRLRDERGDVLGAAWAIERAQAGDGVIEVDGAMERTIVAGRAMRRRARIGSVVEGQRGVSVLEGWTLTPAIDRAGSSRQTGYAVVSRPVESVEGGAVEIGVLRADDDAVVEVQWTRRFSSAVRVVRADADAVYLHDRTRFDRRIICLDARDGTERWSRAGLLARRRGDRGDAFVTPMDGRVRPGDALVASDGATLVLGERGGRLVGIDLRSGAVLWNEAGVMSRVHDVAVRSGRVVIGGAGGGNGVTKLGEQRLVVLDARAGTVLAQTTGAVGPIGGAVRWVRLGVGGELLVGLEGGIARLDPLDLSVVWGRDDGAVRGSLEAWAIGGRLIVLGSDRSMRQIDIATGRTKELDTGSVAFSHAAVGVQLIQGTDEGEDSAPVLLGGPIVLTSGSGLVVIAGDGSVVGGDALDAGDALVPAVAGAGVFVTIDRRRGARSGTHLLYLMDHTGRLIGEPIRLLLNRASPPVALQLLDGVILVGTRDAVIALPADGNLE